MPKPTRGKGVRPSPDPSAAMIARMRLRSEGRPPPHRGADDDRRPSAGIARPVYGSRERTHRHPDGVRPRRSVRRARRTGRDNRFPSLPPGKKEK